MQDYYKAIELYDKAISRKRSLLLAIRMNKVWQHKPGKKELIEELQSKLACLVIPPKPTEPTGYQIYDTNGDFEGFTLDESEALEYIELNGGTIKAVSAIKNK
jgi:hypothetical protein